MFCVLELARAHLPEKPGAVATDEAQFATRLAGRGPLGEHPREFGGTRVDQTRTPGPADLLLRAVQQRTGSGIGREDPTVGGRQQHGLEAVLENGTIEVRRRAGR